MNQFSLIQSTDKDEFHLLIDDNQLATLLPIPRGSFLREDNCTITVDGFYMAQFPVTQELYEAVMGENPANFEGKNHPVETVMWYDAVAFCEAMNKALGIVPGFYRMDKDNQDNNNINEYDKLKWKVEFNQNGKGFRLPTESEWEYAAKGSLIARETVEYAGSKVLDHVGWYEKNNDYETKPAGLKFPNAFGLYDMSGNVDEWCWDWYDNYNKIEFSNPKGAKAGTSRINRGGSWSMSNAYSRIANSDRFYPDNHGSNLGFRLVFVP